MSYTLGWSFFQNPLLKWDGNTRLECTENWRCSESECFQWVIHEWSGCAKTKQDRAMFARVKTNIDLEMPDKTSCNSGMDRGRKTTVCQICCLGEVYGVVEANKGQSVLCELALDDPEVPFNRICVVSWKDVLMDVGERLPGDGLPNQNIYGRRGQEHREFIGLQKMKRQKHQALEQCVRLWLDEGLKSWAGTLWSWEDWQFVFRVI